MVSFASWQRYVVSIRSLLDMIEKYATFNRMIRMLRDPRKCNIMSYLQWEFLLTLNPINVVDIEKVTWCEFLAAEGVLVPLRTNKNMYMMASPLLCSLILWFITSEMHKISLAEPQNKK